jgi:hypothetical protein
MMLINLKNIEEIIFFDKKLQQLLPDFDHVFKTWSLGKKISALKHLSQKAIFDFIDSLNDSHIEILKKYFQTNEIKISSINPHIVNNYIFELKSSEEELNKLQLHGNFFIYRDESKLYIDIWN